MDKKIIKMCQIELNGKKRKSKCNEANNRKKGREMD